MAVSNRTDPVVATAALTRWFTAWDGTAGHAEVMDARVPADSGLSNETLLLDVRDATDGTPRSYAVRIGPDGPGVFPTYDLAREQRIMHALASGSSIPVPTVHAYEPDPSVLGGPFLLIRIAGRTPADDPPYTVAGWLHEATPAERSRICDAALTVLADLHRVKWRRLGVEDLERHGSDGTALGGYLDDLEAYFAWATTLEIPIIDAGLRWLREHRPADERPAWSGGTRVSATCSSMTTVSFPACSTGRT